MKEDNLVECGWRDPGKSRASVLLALVLAGSAFADEVRLVEDGVARCRVVVSEDASAPERFGAEELATYLDKATGCGSLNGDYPICIGVKEHPALREDGFAIEVTPEKMTVVGANPRGALYGCYEILKRFAGVRWLVPGDDGEYVPQAKTVAAPVGRIVRNPYLRIREARCDDGLPGRYWLVRNNMLSLAPKDSFFDKDGKLSDTGRLYEKLTVRGTGATGHLMSTLLLGENSKAAAERLFAAHPDYFPLINGERRMIWTHNDPNPCVSNPAVLDVMAANLVKRAGGEHGSEAYCEIGNNDTTLWCQCDGCKALDPPETKGTRGELSDRYWWFVNELAKRVWREVPHAKICGAPYQNFWFAPVRVRPDPRLYCFVSFNNQCWRHSVGDPKCSVNKTMREIFESFKRFDMPLVFNRDEIGAWDGQGSPGCEFQPAESVFAQNVLDYPAIACNGSHLCVPGPCPEYSNFAKKWSPYFGRRYHWYAMWQTCYVASLMMFDPMTDWKAELEHANRLFYGAAWEGGMKEFRALLTKCFLEAPGCVGWGQHAPMGRCLDAAGSEEKLKALLEQAVAAAKESGDARSLKHVLREKEIFGLTWLVQRRKYLENFKELSAYRRTGEIRIDGVLDEADWRNADAVSDFQVKPGERAGVQSYVRVVYDQDTLYVAVEAMEPTPERILAPIQAPDALHGLGDRLEVFYNYPDMADRAYHLCINSKGACVAARQNSTSDRETFKTAAKIATKVGKDRWTLELAIPCSEIGQNCFDGASWKLNVARERLVEGMARTSSSSCCKGHFHGPANFLNVKFTPARVKGIGQNHATSSWNNPGFDANRRLDPRDKARFKGYVGEDDREPNGWNVMDVTGEYHRKDGSKDDWYMTLRHAPGNNVRQYFMLGDAAKLKAIFRARGRGRLRLWTCSFVLTPDKKNYNADPSTQKTFFYDLSDEWQTFSAVVEKKALPTDRVAFWFCADKDSVVDLDDAVVTRIE